MALAERPPAPLAAPDPSPAARLRELAGLGQRARPVALAQEQLLPVGPSLAPLLPRGGLRRGTCISVQKSTSLALALVAEASAAGSWVGAVSLPGLGALAAVELGVDLARFALVPKVDPAQWPVVVSALLDALDVVLVGTPAGLRRADARRLMARARERGAVLVVVEGGWSEPVDIRLTAGVSVWQGLGDGHGHLAGRRLEVVAGGRGAAAREQRLTVTL